MARVFACRTSAWLCGAVLIALSAGSLAGVAQEPTTPGAPAGPEGQAAPRSDANTIRTNSKLVVLDAVVIDKQGHAVTGLTRDDFKVTEDGDPQSLRYFDEPGKYAVPVDADIESTADLDRVAPRAPVNIVVLDEFNTLFEDMAFARYSLKKWLDSQPDKLSTPTMLVAVDLQHFTVLRDYTQNKQALLDALDHHFAAYPWQATQFSWQGERYATAILTLRRVADATLGHEGHKNMIWLGRGFPTRDRARFTGDEENRVHSAIEITVNKLRDARVTLYTIDPAGVQTDPFKYGEDAGLFAPFGGDPDFQAIARATGGRAIFGRNDVDAQIATSIRDGASLYTLVYRPTEDGTSHNEFHAIKVTTVKPGLTVVTRAGYYPNRRPPKLRDDGTMTKRLAGELVGAETSNMAYDAVPFVVQAMPATPGSYMVHIDGKGLVWTKASGDTPRQARVILMVTTFDKKGKELVRDAHALTAHAPETDPVKGALDRAIELPYKLAMDPKAVRARFVVRVEATGRIGTADLPLGPGASAQVSSSATAETAKASAPATP